MCILKIYSETNSFTKFAEETQMPVVICKIKNEPHLLGSKRINPHHSISLNVSDLEWNNIQGQIKDAVSFLTTWELELIKLIASHNTIDAYLDFPLYSRLGDNIINQNDLLPKELIVLAGRIGLGILMSIYDKNAFIDIDT